MMEKEYIIALDQGTTSSRAILFDKEQRIVSVAQKEFQQIFPKPGWVEHDPMEIYQSQMAVLQEAVEKSGVLPQEIAAIGITNQRETTIVWEKETGKPIYNAIVWQCRRTAEICEDLIGRGLSVPVREKTGLIIDAYFSGTKLKWILDNVANARERAERGELLFGTVDTWLVWKMTGGQVHVTDYTNASRTMLFNIRELKWDQEILNILGIPESMLPTPEYSSKIYGYYDLNGVSIPIAGIAGDQQAALFGQVCFEEGQVKNTYGTGCFLLMNTGTECRLPKSGLLATIGVALPDRIDYAVEGSVFIGGAVVQWLRDEMGLLEDSGDSEKMSLSVADNGGVYFVPAFTGLGAPYWDMYARGAIMGITRGTKKEHIVRAAVESMAFQTKDLLEAIQKETGIVITDLKVDGGASQNNFLMQFQADICGIGIQRPVISETTALGAAYLAGLAVGLWSDTEEIRKLWRLERAFHPKMKEGERRALDKGWQKAVERTLNWETE